VREQSGKGLSAAAGPEGVMKMASAARCEWESGAGVVVVSGIRGTEHELSNNGKEGTPSTEITTGIWNDPLSRLMAFMVFGASSRRDSSFHFPSAHRSAGPCGQARQGLAV
ncbi:hypothetical protein V496_10270, partial [Pseudogymnoascus sp. VKM F-4515 (FW-2607)]